MSVEVGGSTQTKSEPNVVPLCDILLVLLIIFMVISPVAQRGIDINLPETQAGSAGSAADASKYVITIEKDQKILLNKEPVDKDMLGDRLRDIYQIKQDKTIFVRADSSLTYSYVLSVIDIAKGAGIETLGVMTTSYETESEAPGDTSGTD